MIYAISAAVLLSVLALLWLPKQLAMCNFYMCVMMIIITGSSLFAIFTS